MPPKTTRHPARPRPPETADPLEQVLAHLAQHHDSRVSAWARRLLSDGESAEGGAQEKAQSKPRHGELKGEAAGG